MKKIVIILVALIVQVSFVNAQDLDSILKKHYEATGTAKLAKVKTMYSEIEMSMMGMQMTGKTYLKRPGKIKTEVEMMGNTMKMGSDGKDFWALNPMTGEPMDMPEDQRTQLLQQIDFEGALWNYKAKGNTVKYLGTAEKEGKGYYKLDVTVKSMKDVKMVMYIDKETYLLTYQDAKVQGMAVTNKFLNYSEIDGIKFPTQFTTSSNGVEQMTVKIKNTAFNKEMADSMFVRPKK